MPCLANYRECPFFAAATAKPAHPPAIEAETEAVATVAEEAPLEEVRAPVEKGIEEVEEEVTRKIKMAEEMAMNLNEKWKEYEETARQLMKLWEETSMNGRHALEAVSSVIDLYEKILDNLDTLLKSGRISERSYEELKKETQSNLEKYKNIKNDLESALKNAERLVVPHIQRVKVAEARPELGKLRLALMKLEQMFKEGKVSQETYERMRKELEARIRWLEQLAGEAA
jgi:ElaB/YqjD/DUF883 family membrane-anchored ribosome-binding protein